MMLLSITHPQSPQVALALFEGDCLRWLGQLVEQGAGVFEGMCHSRAAMEAASDDFQAVSQLLSLFEVRVQ